MLDQLERGDWVVPMLAGEPFLEKPPLFYIVAAGFARVFGGVLPLHDAARLASGFFLALTLIFLALTARELNRKRHGWTAVLVLTVECQYPRTEGVALCGALIGTLWLPYLDAGKSYRGMIVSLLESLPEVRCVASLNLGESQRALLHYFGRLRTVREEVVSDPPCEALLVQDSCH